MILETFFLMVEKRSLGRVGHLADIGVFCCQGHAMGADEGAAAVLAGKFAEVRPHMDERTWRLYLGSEARAYAAWAGCSPAAAAAVVAGAAGVSRATVSRGAGELAD